MGGVNKEQQILSYKNFKIAIRNGDGGDDSDGKIAQDWDDWDVVGLIQPPPPIEYRL